MKIKIFSITFLLIAGSIQLSKAQFNFNPIGPPLSEGQTVPTVRTIGIGNWPAFAATSARLHINNFYCAAPAGPLNGLLLRTDGLRTVDNSWSMFTGNTAATTTQKARMYIPALSSMLDIESTLAGIQLDAAGGLSSLSNSIQQRMIVTNGDFVDAVGTVLTKNVTRVGISYGQGVAPITNPAALLSLGYNTNPGYRPWMDIGTYMAKGDNMYVGLKDEATPPSAASNRQDAVINWGDDGTGAAGPDNLRFIFTGVSGPPAATQFNGYEAGRVTPFGNWGVGNFYNSPLFPFGNPVRRMEILSDKAVAAANGNAQLRLTNYQQDPANLTTTGKFAELHDLQTGDLAITAQDNTQINTAAQFFQERFVGINTLTPGNTLEINSQYAFPTTPNGQPTAGPPFGAPTGWAGLRFKDLVSNSTPQANPGPGVLSVNKFGDVIYVPGNTSSNFGNICGGTQNPLTNNWEIPLGGFNYVFTGQGPFTGYNVGIGTACAPTAKLEVRRTNVSSGAGTTTGLFVENSDNAITNRIGMQSNVFGTSTNAYGILTTVTGSSGSNFAGNFAATGAAQYNRGAFGSAQGASILNAGFESSVGGTGSSSNYGFRSFTYNIGPATTGFNYGLQSQTTGGLLNFGLWEQVYGGAVASFGLYDVVAGATTNYGVYASVPPGTSNWAGFFNGQTYCGGTTFPSDQAIKKDIHPIANALALIDSLKPVSFSFDTTITNPVGLYVPTAKQYGFKAQDVQLVLPELVVNTIKPEEHDSAGVVTKAAYNFKSINYNAFIGILAAGIQDQQKQLNTKDSIINTLKNEDSIQDYRLTNLENALNNCCNNNHSLQQNPNSTDVNSISATDVKLTNAQSIVLEQNVPNPFAEQTTINYFLPDDVSKAQMLFYNSTGNLIQSVELTQHGKGQLNVFASDLTNGIYTYTLVVDGKVIETKKMVKQ